MDESKKHYPEQMKQDTTECITWFHLYELLEKGKSTCGESNQNSGCGWGRGMEVGVWEGVWETRKLMWWKHLSSKMAATQVYAFVKAHPTIHLRCMHLLCMSHTSMSKLNRKEPRQPLDWNESWNDKMLLAENIKNSRWTFRDWRHPCGQSFLDSTQPTSSYS